MGRTNRSRKRSDEMNKAKKERYDAKELVRLKKTLGLIDADGNEIMKDISDVAEVKTSKQVKESKKSKEVRLLEMELEDERDKGQKVTVVNEKSGKTHVYNTKTLRDQYGCYPPWFRPRKTARRLNRKAHALKKNYKSGKSSNHIPLD